MGNRAVITIKCNSTKKEDWQSIYLHWNGGINTVKPLLYVAKLYNIRCESSYGIARLCQIIGNCLGGTLSLGVGSYKTLDTDNGDNGVYIIENWEIVAREFNQNAEPETNDHFNFMVDEIRSKNDLFFGYKES